jgi:hypothetical protein
MAGKSENSDSVFVVVTSPGAGESFLGLHDKREKIDFISAFQSR